MSKFMQKVDSIIYATWIIPVIPKNTVYQDHALVIHQGKIIAIAPKADIEKKYHAIDTHRLEKQVLIPGLINAHTHSPMSLMRGLADDLPLMEWLEKHIWPAEAQHVNSEFVAQGSELAIAEMLLSGTTTFNDMYFFPEYTAQVADRIGMRCVLGQIIIDFPSAWAKNSKEYFAKGKALHQHYQHHQLISTCLAPHAPYTVNDENLSLVKQQAEDLSVAIHIHCHETESEVSNSLSQYQLRPLERLNNLGLLSEKLIAVHMTKLNEQDQALVCDKKVNIVHCPESNMKLASGIAPINALLKQGVNVALGTDGAASNNDLDMIGEMKSASLLAKVSSEDATALPAQQALEMATINGAKALGLADKIGSLEVGKQADICSICFDNINTIPLYHPISQLVYSTAKSQVSNVWINGKQQMKNHELLHIDSEQLHQYAHTWQLKLQHLK